MTDNEYDLSEKIAEMVHEHTLMSIRVAAESTRTVYYDDIGERIIALIKAEGFNLSKSAPEEPTA